MPIIETNVNINGFNNENNVIMCVKLYNENNEQ
jgi:hypothetical protein